MTNRRKEWIRSRRNRRKHARRARLNRQVFRYLLLLTVFSAGCYGMTRLNWKISNPDADVIVRGNNVVTAQQVRTALGDIGCQKIFQLDPHKLEKKVENLKAVKYAFVRRYSIPKPTIVVEVLEEFPWATFSTSPELPPQGVIPQSGRLIPLSEFPRMSQPALIIYGPSNLKLTSKSVSQWASSISFIGSQTGEPVQAVDMRRSYEIGVQDGDLFLKLGGADATLNRRLGRLSSILSAIEPLKSRLEYVDLSLDNNIPLKVAKKPIENRQLFGGAGAAERSMQAALPQRGNI